MKKNAFLLCILSCIVSNCLAQFSSPILWLRADQTDSTAHAWIDVSGNGYDCTFAGDTVNADSLLNFNPAFAFSGRTALQAPPLPIIQEVNSVIIVYEADTASEAEFPLWRFSADSTHTMGLSTQNIICADGTFRYGTANEKKPVINCLTQMWMNRQLADTLMFSGDVGHADTTHFIGKIAEFVVLPSDDDCPQDTLVTQWMTYLAVKYGITLKQMDYIASDRRTLWALDDQPEFSFQIVGIGRDDAFGLYQRQTYLADKQMVMGLEDFAADNASNTGTLRDGDFLLAGISESGFTTASELYLESDTSVLRYGDGLVRVSSETTAAQPTFLLVDASDWEGDLEGYLLLIDRDGNGNYGFLGTECFAPTAIDTIAKTLYFNNIQWDTDGNGLDRFCFVRATMEDFLPEFFSERGLTSSANGAANGSGESSAAGQNTIGQYALYPNPNSGKFALEVHYPTATPVAVNIYASDGRLLQHIEREEDSNHLIEGSISMKGQHLVEIITAGEKHTIKMVVQ